jgi:DNA-binding PadR family transcriptional regulator
MPASRDDLILGEWAVLALVAEAPTHGFEIARAMAPGGEIGAVWAMRRPVVYRAVDELVARGLVEPRGDESSPRGPRRRILRTTRAGRARLRRWLAEPVEHVRDARSALLLKLLFLDRAGRDPTALLEAQAELFGAALRGLEERRARAQGFDRVLFSWRAESASAAVRFVEAVAVAEPSGPRRR